ncbi:hypothetical protein B0T11DRAFT_285981 [Plectosphaerella cucumerina]|uniref:Uncharacterized protein n=1 Tax=Plectosphaerella cucumerina TaxID=40658 RepID=A0A8K0TC52_9PEZI|nr:hypothetical protein B0T11DRAFT_285981 [Plectosphaerella cucumerina]
MSRASWPSHLTFPASMVPGGSFPSSLSSPGTWLSRRQVQSTWYFHPSGMLHGEVTTGAPSLSRSAPQTSQHFQAFSPGGFKLQASSRPSVHPGLHIVASAPVPCATASSPLFRPISSSSDTDDQEIRNQHPPGAAPDVSPPAIHPIISPDRQNPTLPHDMTSAQR